MKKTLFFLWTVVAASSLGWAKPELKLDPEKPAASGSQWGRHSDFALAPVRLSCPPDQAVRQVLEDVKNPVILVVVDQQPPAAPALAPPPAPAPAPPAPPPRGTVPLPPGSEVEEEEEEGGSIVPS